MSNLHNCNDAVQTAGYMTNTSFRLQSNALIIYARRTCSGQVLGVVGDNTRLFRAVFS